AGDRMVGNANVVGGIAAVLALVAAVAMLWPRGRLRAETVVSAGQVQAVVEYLARETLRYWRGTGQEPPAPPPTPPARGGAVGGTAAVLALVAAVAMLWPRGRLRAETVVSAGQVQAVVEYLARETLRYWRAQAKDRRITTPSPAAVCWRWASEEVAVPPGELW